MHTGYGKELVLFRNFAVVKQVMNFHFVCPQNIDLFSFFITSKAAV